MPSDPPHPDLLRRVRACRCSLALAREGWIAAVDRAAADRVPSTVPLRSSGPSARGMADGHAAACRGALSRLVLTTRNALPQGDRR